MRRLWTAVRGAPIIVPRWMLTAKYALFVALGVVAGIAGIPTLSLTTWEGYTTIWAVLLAVGAAVAAVGSLRVRCEPAEAAGATVVVALLSAYAIGAMVLAVGSADSGRAALAIVLLIVTLLPAVRAVPLLLRVGVRRD